MVSEKLCEECGHAISLHVEGGCEGDSGLCGCQEWEVETYDGVVNEETENRYGR